MSRPEASIQVLQKRLRRLGHALLTIAIIGQFLFAFYIIAFYGGIAWSGDLQKINDQLPHGIMQGDTMGNFMLGVHLSLAAVIMLGGPIQFIPAIRQRFPAFHRWNGRIYYMVAFLITGAGLYMIFTRGAHGGWFMALGNVVNATLIISFSIAAWRTARQRDFVAHKRWAIRAFLMVSGVWFFRIGYGIWILGTGFQMFGAEADLTGPFDRFLSLGHSLVPLLILELYFLARSSHSSHNLQRGVVALLAACCLLLTVGMVMVAMVFWWPAF